MSDSMDGVKVRGDWIDGVSVTRLRRITDERGEVMHMLKATDPTFTEFGEIYFSCGYPGVVKAWHVHRRMTINDCCVVGMIKLVLFDGRADSPTRGSLMECFIGERNYCLVQVPPGVANGYKVYGTQMAIVANCASMPHDPGELEYIDPFDSGIDYEWSIRHG